MKDIQKVKEIILKHYRNEKIINLFFQTHDLTTIKSNSFIDFYGKVLELFIPFWLKER